MIPFFGCALAGSFLAYQLQQYLKKRSIAAEQNAWNHGGSRTINPPHIATGPSLIGKVHLNPFQNHGLSKEEKTISARRALQIDENVANIAVCGNSGTGKSTFINCIRGIPDIEMRPNFQHAIEGAAPVGIMETTKMRNQYKSSDDRLSFLTLWDLPSVGAMSTPNSNYFEDQMLYAFDCILLLKANRFTQFDIDICRQALEYNIPLILVLNKGDQDVES
ncbi:unnamed protein product [Didymodactylos carnosus]|uniref:IRG-type G domain-containing protein n=1 Tax=Didymodactylos carnosus TaxID=1234261 RepID=A0A814UWD2_9BILA|nr:unnamed protein product [Didymodactylos carnosus]CAF1330931.1 unnamed protein product [Didymodactylos carnosus]CAF3941621.1 unnamed protein product [Didymodactylos carnosus]CAF4142368.1 unnamed protein product [Didymodactylos carnosus]